MWNDNLTRLRDRLVMLIPDRADAQVLADEAGLPKGLIAFSDRAETNWHHILTEAEKRGGVGRVIRAALSRYPDDQILREAESTWGVMASRGTGHAAKGAVVDEDPKTADLAIVTAMEDELTPVLNLIGGEERWQRKDIDGFIHRYSNWPVGERNLTVVATALWKYGDNPTTGAVHRLRSRQPKLVAMSGICAGWLGKDGIALGDVLIAERAFNPAEGKQEGGLLRPDTHPYYPPAWLIQELNDFAARDKEWPGEIKSPRPVSLRYQAEWLLCKLSGRDSTVPFPSEADWRSMKRASVDFGKAAERLMSLNLVTTDFALTDDGQEVLRVIQRLNKGSIRPLKDACEVDPIV